MRTIASAFAVALILLTGCTSTTPEPAESAEEPPAAFVVDPTDNPRAAEMETIAAEILDTPTREADALALIEAEGFTARVVERDGEPFPVTMDYRIDRFNLVVVDDVVTEMTVG